VPCVLVNFLSHPAALGGGGGGGGWVGRGSPDPTSKYALLTGFWNKNTLHSMPGRPLIRV